MTPLTPLTTPSSANSGLGRPADPPALRESLSSSPPRPVLPASRTDDTPFGLSTRSSTLAYFIRSRSTASLLGDSPRPQSGPGSGVGHGAGHGFGHGTGPRSHSHRQAAPHPPLVSPQGPRGLGYGHEGSDATHKADGDATVPDTVDGMDVHGPAEVGPPLTAGQMHHDPYLRTVRLIGNSIPRYQWEKYWRTGGELRLMKKSIRRYYERTNNLIQQYRYIDRLLDSDTPYALLSNYTDVDPTAAAEAAAAVHSSPAIAVPGANNDEPPSSTPRSSEPAAATAAAASSVHPKKAAPTPREIFRSTDSPAETTPLLPHSRDGSDYEEGTRTRTVTRTDRGCDNADVEAAGGPEPEFNSELGIAWDDNGVDVESGSPVVTVAIWVNFVANAILLAAKIVVVIKVPSMSVLASLVDAGLDFLSTGIVWATTRLISRGQRDQHLYPVGRRKLEPLGVLVFSVVMITSFTQVAVECVQRLASADHSVIELGVAAICIMAGTIVIKGAVWIWYRLVRNSSVRALADDAKTDVVFNTGSILFPIIGVYARLWWLDALGGLFLSCFVIFSWGKTSMHHVRNLTGFSAEPDERNLLLYLAMRFSGTIRQIQNLRAYHAGDKLLVEADIVLAPHTPLKDSHDLSEVLTYFLESVPFVERAFVHVDYASYHLPTHLQQGDA